MIASVASAAAALLTSQLWIGGTWIAAAVTPVIVTLVSAVLNRPAERIARSLTSDHEAPQEAGGPARPGPARRPSRGRKIAYGAVFGTAALALVIAVVAITVPELIAGRSGATNDRPTTFFGEGDREPDSEKPRDTAPDDETRPEEQQEQQERPTRPADKQPTSPDEEQPTPPPEATPTPGEPLPETAPNRP